MREFTVGNSVFININDIREKYKHTYCKGIRSNNQLLERKNIKDYVYGRIIDEKLVITEKLSKKLGSIFINKNALKDLYDNEVEYEEAPPLIQDSDLVFFKDDNGCEYDVKMRGKRTKDDIYFQVNGIMAVFEMPGLNKTLLNSKSLYEADKHYKFFKMSFGVATSKQQFKEMYLTYDGLIRVIHVSKCGVAHKFKAWIDEIVFASLWETKEKKVETFKKLLNVDADHLKAIMGKSPNAISCLYLIDINRESNGKRVFKYGFTMDIQRRFREHTLKYGENSKLDTFILIPQLSLSKAEVELKNSISRYHHEHESEKELIALCDEGYLNAKTIFSTISQKHCGNLATQITEYESQIKDMQHKLKVKDMELAMKDQIIVIKDKDIEILELKLQLCSKK